MPNKTGYVSIYYIHATQPLYRRRDFKMKTYQEQFQEKISKLFNADSPDGTIHINNGIADMLMSNVTKALGITIRVHKCLFWTGENEQRWLDFRTPHLKYQATQGDTHVNVLAIRDLLDPNLNTVLFESLIDLLYNDNVYIRNIQIATEGCVYSSIISRWTSEYHYDDGAAIDDFVAKHIAYIHDEIIVSNLALALSEGSDPVIHFPGEGEYRLVKNEDDYIIHFYPSDDFKQLAWL